METFQLNIVSADRALFAGKAAFVVAPLAEGEAGFLPGHSPLLGRLKAGAMRVRDEAGVEQTFYVSGGFVEVQPDRVTVLADNSERAADIDEALALQAVEDAEQALRDRLEKVDYARAESELAEAIARLRVARAHKGQGSRLPPDYVG